MRELLLIALIVACPLLMMWMMRGGHGHGGHADGGHAHGHDGCGGHGHSDSSASNASTDDLRRQRDELNRLIEGREAEEETPTPVGGG